MTGLYFSVCWHLVDFVIGEIFLVETSYFLLWSCPPGRTDWITPPSFWRIRRASWGERKEKGKRKQFQRSKLGRAPFYLPNLSPLVGHWIQTNRESSKKVPTITCKCMTAIRPSLSIYFLEYKKCTIIQYIEKHSIYALPPRSPFINLKTLPHWKIGSSSIIARFCSNSHHFTLLYGHRISYGVLRRCSSATEVA